MEDFKIEDEIKKIESQGWIRVPSNEEYPKEEFNYISVGSMLFKKPKK